MADRRRREGSAAIMKALFRSVWPAIGMAFLCGWLTSSEIVGLSLGAASFAVLTTWQLRRFDRGRRAACRPNRRE